MTDKPEFFQIYFRGRVDMVFKKTLILSVAALSFGTGMAIRSTPAHALASYWVHSHWVTIRKTSTVEKIRIVDPIYKSPVVAKYKVHKGAHYKLGHYDTNYSWVLRSGRFHSNSHYTYIVKRGWNNSSWFKF